MSYPQRKQTRLPQYDYSATGAYFITVCTRGKAKILGSIVGGGALDAPRMELSPIGEIVEKFILSTNNVQHLTVDKYCIMPNHIHLLLSICIENGASKAPPPTARARANAIIPHAVATLKRFSNTAAGENLWQRSFHDHVVRDERDYREIWDYIDTNPMKWEEDTFFKEDSL